MAAGERFVEIAGEYGTLRGLWYAPAIVSAGEQHPPSYPAVVMLHGLTGSHQSNGFLFVGMARQLAAAGFGVLNMDLFGSGDSDGELSEMSLYTELSDAHRMFDYALSQPGVDPTRIGILGYSMGGRLSALFVGEEPRVQALVAWSPAVHPRMIAYFRDMPAPRRYGGHVISDAFVESVENRDPLAVLDAFTKPTLVLNGTGDEAVPPEAGRLFADHARATFIPIEGANHGYDHPDWRVQLYGATRDHFVKTLANTVQ